MSPRPAESPPDPWDIVVRVSHWVIAGVVVANAALTEGGGALHVWLGWIAMGFLLIRLLWGFVGRAEARFAAFPPRPIAALSHLNRLIRRRPREFASHNPAGALMVYALWAVLAVVIASGLVMTRGAMPWDVSRQQAAVDAGDWSALVTEEGEAEGGADERAGHLVAEVHEIGGNLLLILAVVHLAGVVAESAVLRRNLVRPMILARRR